MKISKVRIVALYTLLVVMLLSNKTLQAQTLDNNDVILRQKIEDGVRVISTGVPLLLIAPDSRSGAMGDVGVATTPDANSIHYNAAKLAFVEKSAGVAFSYTPWLRDLVGDIDLSYLSAFYKINDRSAVGGSLTYFSLGSIDFYDVAGENKGNFKPNEFAIDLAYSMKLSDNLSASVTGRYIRSDLTQGQNVGTTSTHAANAFGTDIGVYYQNTIGEEEDSHLGDFIPDEDAPAPAEVASFQLLREQLEEVLTSLTPREQKVLKLRFGLEDGRARTLEEVGKEFGVTRERIRQIEAKALRKLRHPSRSKKLKDYLD